MTGPMRLLLVEDDPANQLTLRALLEDEGFQVDAVGTCREARVTLASGCPYGAIVVDHHLPDGSGLDLVRPLWNSEERPAILLHTGDAPVTTEVLWDAVFIKGVPFHSMMEQLHLALERRLRRSVRG